MHSIRIDSFSAAIATILPRSVGENITAGKVAKAALAILVGVGNFCLFPWQIAAPLTLVTTYLIYKIDTMFSGTTATHQTGPRRPLFLDRDGIQRQIPRLVIISRYPITESNSPSLLAPRVPPVNRYEVTIPRKHEVVSGGHQVSPSKRRVADEQPTVVEREVVGDKKKT